MTPSSLSVHHQAPSTPLLRPRGPIHVFEGSPFSTSAPCHHQLRAVCSGRLVAGPLGLRDGDFPHHGVMRRSWTGTSSRPFDFVS